MFPFPTDINKYTEISSGDANARRCFHSPSYSFVAPVNLNQLPGSLQKVNNLVAAYVSGVSNQIASPVFNTNLFEVTFTVRFDMKDFPATGNAYAYCILQSGEKFFMSPPCPKLGAIPHHFSGKIPFEFHLDPVRYIGQSVGVMNVDEMGAMFSGVYVHPDRLI